MTLVAFPIGKGKGPIYGGITLRAGEIIILPPGQHTHMRTDGLCDWGTILVSVEELTDYGSALTGIAFTLPLVQQCGRPEQAADENLLALHAAATEVAETRPQALADAEAVHGLKQQVIEALVECLTVVSADAGSAAACRHQDIMVRFEHLLQAQPYRKIRMTEISAALSVSDRLLRTLCAEHLGMSGNRYLRLRRMSLVHHALQCGGRGAAKVSVVARLYGFSDLGRLAANYRGQFGELPSATLRRGSGRQIVQLKSYPSREHK
jgi:AraC family ethanolamine operon transcriptional activator